MTKKRATLNRTISISKHEIDNLKNDLLYVDKPVDLKFIKDKIVNEPLEKILDFLPDKFVDLLFIDPPYNLTKRFNSISFKSMELKEYQQWFESWFAKLIRLLKDNASVYICGDWKTSQAIFYAGIKYLKVRNRISWEREKGRGSKMNWKNCSEDIWFFTKSDNYTFNIDNVKLRRKVLAPYRDPKGRARDWAKDGNLKFRDTFPSNLWTDISVPFWSMPENTDHPTQKPEKLLAKIILASSNKNDIVFDPFLGSGTTTVVAKKLGRHFIGVEMDEHYCCLAQKRLRIAEQNKEIQGYNDGIFWERNTLREQLKKKKKL